MSSPRLLCLLLVAIGSGCTTVDETAAPPGPGERVCPLASAELDGGRGKPLQVEAGGEHTCVRYENGEVWCWGLILYAGAAVVPTRVPVGCIVELAGGGEHHCARDYWGAVWCWGADAFGQSGHYGHPSFAPRPVDGVTGAVQVTAGKDSSAALLETGEVIMWGFLPTVPVRVATTPEVYDAARDVAQLPKSGVPRCFVHRDRTVSCAGDNRYGQAGVGTTQDVATPTTVQGLGPATRVATDCCNATCAIETTGAVVCWGSGLTVGDGNPDGALAPRGPVAGLTDAVDISVQTAHVCAASSDGTAWCWGQAFTGELGHGIDHAVELTPIQVLDVFDVVDITAGAGHSCALQADGSVWCWGDNLNGQLGYGIRGLYDWVSFPVLVPLPGP